MNSLAEQHHVEPARVVVGCGSISILQRIVQLSCTDSTDRVVITWPTAQGYPRLIASSGAGQERVALTSDHRMDLDAMLEAITPNTRAILLCNPHNPTGTAISTPELRSFLAAVPEEVLVVVDEAYHGFAPDTEVADGIALAHELWSAGHENIAIVRTFSKAYGLAGLRVGYGIAAPVIADALRRAALPFEASGPAQKAAVAALDTGEEVTTRCMGVVRERSLMRKVLSQLGYPVTASQANFLWLPLGPFTEEFAQHCLRYGISVLDYPGYGVRLPIGTPQQNTLVVRAATAFIPRSHS